MSFLRSTLVFTPSPLSIYTTSSVATLPVAPFAYGQPPRPDTDESTTLIPICFFTKVTFFRMMDAKQNIKDSECLQAEM
ncbi:hypothetical protein HanRHA438_Chr01g0011371 [Helianthus annuus]|nr:hypothetical protein HanRHA438_Chr01g0011371 [Helianthus annuus]